MTDYTVKRLALVLAIQSEIEGMKAFDLNKNSNHQWDSRCQYTEDQYKEKAEELRNLAYIHDHQL